MMNAFMYVSYLETYSGTEEHRESYMIPNVLLNILGDLRKMGKMRGLSSILSFFRNKFY